MNEDLKFEADLVTPDKWPKYSKGILLILLLLSVIVIISNGIHSVSTNGWISDTLVYSFGLALLICLVLIILAFIYGAGYQIKGKLIIDADHIIAGNKTFILPNLEKVSITATSYKGGIFSSESTPGDGLNYIMIDQGAQRFIYWYILTSDSKRLQLARFITQVNQIINRELFIISKAKVRDLL